MQGERVAAKANSRRAVDLDAAVAPLRRSFDQVVDYPRAGRSTAAAHVRMWRDVENETGRVVVVIGQLHGGDSVANFIEDLVRYLDKTALQGRAHEAVWFDYHPEPFGPFSAHRVTNIELTFAAHYNTEERTAGHSRFWQRWGAGHRQRAGQGPDLHPTWHDSSVAEIERIIGDSLECYPPPAYTREVIAGHTAEPDRLQEVTHDPIRSGALLNALAFVDAVPVDHEFAATAAHAGTLLADALRERWPQLSPELWDDGTQSHGMTPWPSVFAARLVPPTLSDADTELLERYPDTFEVSTDPEREAQLRGLLGQLRVWRDETAADAETPDSRAHAALATADNLLTVYLRSTNHVFAAEDHPDHRYRRFRALGEFDLRYLDSIAWEDETGTGPRYVRLLEQVSVAERAHVRIGTDPWHHLVAYIPSSDGQRAPDFCMEWPLRPPAEPLTSGSLIVADGGESGDRPVYIELPNGTLMPMPDQPDHREGQWHFGYHGGGPAALQAAILRLLTRVDNISDDRFPHRWVEQQVTTASSRLVISVAQIRNRFA